MTLAQGLFLFLATVGAITMFVGIAKNGSGITLTGIMIFVVAMLGYSLSPSPVQAMEREAHHGSQTVELSTTQIVEAKSSDTLKEAERLQRKRLGFTIIGISMLFVFFLILLVAVQKDNGDGMLLGVSGILLMLLWLSYLIFFW